MLVTLEGIKFNHDPRSAAEDAFNIRKNEKTPVVVPEWRPGMTKPEESVAAYALSETSGNGITIQAKFHRHNTNIKKLEIRAIDPQRPSGSEVDEWIDAIFSWLPFSRDPNRNILGRVEGREIQFLANDESDFESFELKDVRIWDAGVSVNTNVWQWQYRFDSRSPWTNFDRSSHRIYTTLKLPKEPWKQDPPQASAILQPWAEVLEFACRWAQGAKTIDEAASLVTKGMRELETTIDLMWEPSPSYSKPNFDCTGCLDLLNGGLGRGHKMNCSDFATVVSTFANILGCELWQSKFSDGKQFRTNPVRVFGRTSWLKKRFTYHEVAWKGECEADDEVFDACLVVDNDDDPTTTPRSPFLPRNMKFGAPEEGNYLTKMAAPLGDQPEGSLPRPKPITRQRRKLQSHHGRGSKRVERERLHFLKEMYDYADWREPSDRNEKTLIAGLIGDVSHFEVEKSLAVTLNTAINKLGFDKILNSRLVTTIDRPPVVQLLLRQSFEKEKKYVLVRFDLEVCSSERMARFFLLQSLGDFQTLTLVRRENLGFGDVTFTDLETGAVLFARFNLVVLFRNADSISADLTEVARKFDSFLIKDHRVEEIEMGQLDLFSVSRYVSAVGEQMLLKVEEDYSDYLLKFNTQSGEVRASKEGFVYRSLVPGPQSVTIVAVSREGKVLKQILDLGTVQQ